MPEQPTESTSSHTLESAAPAILDLLTRKPGTREPESHDADEADEAPTARSTDDAEPDDAEDDEAVAADEADDDAEADPDADDEAEPEKSATTDEPKPEDTPRRHKLATPEGEIEVDEEELKKGYLRTADYTRKTQATAAERQQAREQREFYAKAIEQITEFLQANTETEPEWERLAADDPAEYAQQHARWTKRQSQLATARAERERLQQEQERETVEAFGQWQSAENHKVLAALPHWKDEAVAKRERAELVTYALQNGYTQDELAMADSRAVLLLRKAMQHDAAAAKAAAAIERAKKPEPRKPVTSPTLKPGGTQPIVSRREAARRDAVQTAVRSGGLDDAAKAISKLLG